MRARVARAKTRAGCPSGKGARPKSGEEWKQLPASAAGWLTDRGRPGAAWGRDGPASPSLRKSLFAFRTLRNPASREKARLLCAAHKYSAAPPTPDVVR